MSINVLIFRLILKTLGKNICKSSLDFKHSIKTFGFSGPFGFSFPSIGKKENGIPNTVTYSGSNIFLSFNSYDTLLRPLPITCSHSN